MSETGTGAGGGTDMMADELARVLAGGLRPVRRRCPLAEAAALVALGAAQLAGFALLMRTVPFAGAAEAALVPAFAKAGALGLGAALLSSLALAGMAPAGQEARGTVVRAVLAAALAAAVIAVGLDWTAVQPGMAGKPVMEGQVGTLFAPRDGLRCLASSLTLALPLALAMTLIGRAAAPPRPRLTATLIGGAAGLWGGFVYAAQCPYLAAPYVLTWYGLAAGLSALAGRALLTRWLRW